MPTELINILIVVLVLILAFLIQNWRARYFDYQCGKCYKRFDLTAWRAVFAPHILGRRYVKCPHCGKWGWVNLVSKQ